MCFVWWVLGGVVVWTACMAGMMGWLLWITRKKEGVVTVCLLCGPVQEWDENGNCRRCGFPVELE
jgi:hypothetical protein